MTPDELRALADALEPMARAPRFEDFDVPGFCAWLRACADAEPVPAGWKLVPVEPTPEMLASTSWPGCAGTDYAHMLAAAPAVPQLADRCRSSETLDPKATGPASPERPASNREDAAATVAAGSGEQAEPKRDWSVIDAAIREYLDGYEQIGENDAGADACYTPTERERDLIYDAINGLLADESFVAAISAPQAEPKREPLSDWRIGELHRQWLANPETVTIADLMRAVERAHGIGGSDE